MKRVRSVFPVIIKYFTMPKTKKVQAKKTASKKTRADFFRVADGMADILPKDEAWWREIWRAGFSISEYHNFHFIETPVIERLDLFVNGADGVNSDIEKRLFVFSLKKGERVVLRPGGILPILRSYVEHHLGYFSSPLKVFSYGPMFRRHPGVDEVAVSHEWGFQIIGDNDPVYDIQSITVVLDFLKSLKIKNTTLKINTNGCRVCRKSYQEKLKNYYVGAKSDLCSRCARMAEKDIASVFMCKEEGCIAVKERAPIILDYLCQSCNNHLKVLLELIEDNGILYESDPYLINDFDGFNRMIFSVRNPSGLELARGERYDYLLEAIGGRQIPGVGSLLLAENVIIAMQEQAGLRMRNKPKVFFIAVGDQAKKASVRHMSLLRSNGVVVIEMLGKKSLKTQLKFAEKTKAPITLLLGQREVFEESLIMRDMETGAQETIMAAEVVDRVKKKFK